MSCRKRWWKRLRRVGLVERPLEVTRKLVRTLVLQALGDLAFLVLLALLLGTLVRALPLLKDLWRHKAFSPTRFTTRKIRVCILAGCCLLYFLHTYGDLMLGLLFESM